MVVGPNICDMFFTLSS